MQLRLDAGVSVRDTFERGGLILSVLDPVFFTEVTGAAARRYARVGVFNFSAAPFATNAVGAGGHDDERHQKPHHRGGNSRQQRPVDRLRLLVPLSIGLRRLLHHSLRLRLLESLGQLQLQLLLARFCFRLQPLDNFFDFRQLLVLNICFVLSLS